MSGAEEPLCGRWPGRVREIHGDNGLGNTELPPTRRSTAEEEIEDFYMRLADKYAGELTLVTLGPLTNVVRTLEKYPSFARKIRRMVMMGGTVAMRGNVSPMGEANVTGDPEACDQVFLSGMDITAVGLDVTMKVRLKREHIEWLNRRRSARGRKGGKLLKPGAGILLVRQPDAELLHRRLPASRSSGCNVRRDDGNPAHGDKKSESGV